MKKTICFFALLTFFVLLAAPAVFADAVGMGIADSKAAAINGGNNLTLEGSNNPQNRPFVNPTSPGFPGTPNEFVNGQEYWNYVKTNEMLLFKTVYTAEEIEAVATNKDMKLISHFWETCKPTKKVHLSATKEFFDEKGDKILNPVKQIGTTVVRSVKGKQESNALMDAIMKVGKDNGSDAIAITGEGVQSFIDTDAFGLSVGFTQVFINAASAGQSGGGVIGLGYVMASAERKGNPFLHITYLKFLPMPASMTKVAPVIQAAPAPAPAPVVKPQEVKVIIEIKQVPEPKAKIIKKPAQTPNVKCNDGCVPAVKK